MPESSLPQLDADVHHLYSLVIDMEKTVRRIETGQRRQGSRLDQIETDVRELRADMLAGFTAVTEALVALDVKLDRVLDSRLSGPAPAPGPLVDDGRLVADRWAHEEVLDPSEPTVPEGGQDGADQQDHDGEDDQLVGGHEG
jgi:hypothetical protein